MIEEKKKGESVQIQVVRLTAYHIVDQNPSRSHQSRLDRLLSAFRLHKSRPLRRPLNEWGHKYRVADIAATLLLAASIAVAMSRVVNRRIVAFDFPYFYTAGKMWSSGLDPYSDTFSSYAKTVLGIAGPLESWVYPPQWALITIPLAQLPYQQALSAWTWINLAVLTVAVFIFSKASDSLRRPPPLWAKFVFGSYVYLCEESREVFSLGQSAIVVFLGVALIALGLAQSKRLSFISGLVLVLFKPQIGVVFAMTFILYPGKRNAALVSVLVSLLGGMVAFGAVGFSHTLSSILNLGHRLSSYGHSHYNLPLLMTGVSVPLARLSDFVVPTMAYSIAAGLLSAYWFRRYAGRDGQTDSLLKYIVPWIFLLVPMHTDDLLFVAPLALAAFGLTSTRVGLVMASLLLMFRPYDLGLIWGSGDRRFEGRAMLSFLAAVLMMAALAPRAELKGRRQPLDN